MILDEVQFHGRYTCPFCQEYAKDAVQTNCCGKFLCQECYQRIVKSNKGCLFRCLGQFKAHPSINARRDIKNTKFDCKFKCGIKLTVKDKQNHENLCQQITKLIKDPIKIYEIQAALVIMWEQLYFKQNGNKSINIENNNKQNLQNKKILQFLSKYLLQFSKNISKTFENQFNYWNFYLEKNSSQRLMLALTILYKKEQNYFQSMRHLIKLLQISNNKEKKLILFELFEKIVKEAIQSKIHEKELIDVCDQYLNRLDDQGQSNIIPIIVSLNCLIRLSIALKNEQFQQKYIVLLSIRQKDINKLLNTHFQRICWSVHIIKNYSTQMVSPSLAEQISQTNFKIFFDTNWIRYILRVAEVPPVTFYQLLKQSQRVFQGQIYYSLQKSKFPQYEVVRQIIRAFENSIKNQNKQQIESLIVKNSYYLSKKNLRLFLFKLHCYLACSNKFKHSEFVIETFVQEINEIIIYDFYDELQQINLKTLQQLKKSSETYQIQRSKLNFKQLPKDEKKLVNQLAKKHIHTFCWYLQHALLGIEQQNVNLQNQCLVFYTIRETILEKFLSPSQQSSVLNFQMVFYHSGSTYFKRESQQYKQLRQNQINKMHKGISSFIELSEKSNSDQNDYQKFIAQATQNIFEEYKQNQRLKSITQEKINADRRKFYSKQNIKSNLQKFSETFLISIKKMEKVVRVPAKIKEMNPKTTNNKKNTCKNKK